MVDVKQKANSGCPSRPVLCVVQNTSMGPNRTRDYTNGTLGSYKARHFHCLNKDTLDRETAQESDSPSSSHYSTTWLCGWGCRAVTGHHFPRVVSLVNTHDTLGHSLNKRYHTLTVMN